MGDTLTRCTATSIPPEILVKIIGFCSTDWFDWLTMLARGHRVNLRLLYTWVCRYWRDVIVSSPCLWTKFHTSSRNEITEPSNACNHVSLRLQRSQNLPLFISLRDIKEKRKSLAFHPGLDVIAPEHRRWKEVVFELSPQAVETFVESQSSWSFDLLQAFSLDVPYDYLNLANPTVFSPGAMFDEAGRLTNLNLRNICLDASAFPWSQLTSLSLASITEADTSIQDILRQCTSLKNLVLDPSDFNEELVQRETTLSLPYLTSLVFGCLQWEYKRLTRNRDRWASQVPSPSGIGKIDACWLKRCATGSGLVYRGFAAASHLPAHSRGSGSRTSASQRVRTHHVDTREPSGGTKSRTPLSRRNTGRRSRAARVRPAVDAINTGERAGVLSEAAGRHRGPRHTLRCDTCSAH
ncbi:hypothetical protein BDV98DRAFT_260915 [Pterulicium gracile]|uniref:Uncharacterized protein n=1 Tax=Pterulicium gracile TaxID=1884261 RepID=A0A5C3Q8W5_9AGAR|nr:hypothetical protein BDV98DRAFT_260915 [Pterula gracilis]